MDLLQFIRLLFRHWFIVGLTLVATGAAAVSFAERVESEYQAQGSLLLLSPSSVESPTGRQPVNPFTKFGTSERIASTLLVNISLSQPFEVQMRERGVPEGYEVTVDPSGSGAIVNIEVIAHSDAEAVRGLEVLRDLLAEELANRQARAGAPQDTWITLEILSFPTRATLLTGSRTRVLAAVAVLGSALAATLAMLAEGLRPRRERRRSKRRERRQVRRDGTDEPGASEREPVAAVAASEPLPSRRERRRRKRRISASGGRSDVSKTTELSAASDPAEHSDDGLAATDRDSNGVSDGVGRTPKKRPRRAKAAMQVDEGNRATSGRTRARAADGPEDGTPKPPVTRKRGTATVPPPAPDDLAARPAAAPPESGSSATVPPEPPDVGP